MKYLKNYINFNNYEIEDNFDINYFINSKYKEDKRFIKNSSYIFVVYINGHWDKFLKGINNLILKKRLMNFKKYTNNFIFINMMPDKSFDIKYTNNVDYTLSNYDYYFDIVKNKLYSTIHF
jgi:hypothetical protein